MNHKRFQVPSAKVDAKKRLRVTVRGAVQGVGFRPFIFRLAEEIDLTGWVNNTSSGVTIEVEGVQNDLERFLLKIESEKPPRAFIQSLEYSYLDPENYTTFEIRESDKTGAKSVLVLPDISTCPECLKDIGDPANRRYQYPFTNCTNCGPRYSIVNALPYDRPNTTMAGFVMCKECLTEYEDPRNRRFHAQPNACPKCGPHLELWNSAGEILSRDHQALEEAALAISNGEIVALKGIGGFHLIADARNDKTVRELRRLKGREEKPFALMYPSLVDVQDDCEISDLEIRMLDSAEAPIVLLRRSFLAVGASSAISDSVAPGNPYLGIMLPYSPLHHLLMAELGFPVVATSGNLSDEPICIDEREALIRLKGIARIFLVHNRPIARPIDDSVARIDIGREMVLRRARGYAPLPVTLRNSSPRILAVGAHLKNTIAASVGKDVFVSQHLGDLETSQAFHSFTDTIKNFRNLYELRPEIIACDSHPDYLSTQYARKTGLPVVQVQHHYAHVLSCMAENDLVPPALGVAWDGTGFGPDGTVWGGEFLKIGLNDYQRAAHFRTFRLPGGEKAIKEPCRSALGMLFEIFGKSIFEKTDLAPLRAFSKQETDILGKMLENSINSHYTSSAGRIFDAVASLTGVRQKTRYEGQAAMELEFSLAGITTDDSYDFNVDEANSILIVDWEKMIRKIFEDIHSGVEPGNISAKFHNTLAEVIVAVSRLIKEPRVVLSGGCFQNRYLTERTVRRLREEGFSPYWHQRIPPNDGGIALGQIVAASVSGIRKR